jgi:hypothetical protein
MVLARGLSESSGPTIFWVDGDWTHCNTDHAVLFLQSNSRINDSDNFITPLELLCWRIEKLLFARGQRTWSHSKLQPRLYE